MSQAEIKKNIKQFHLGSPVCLCDIEADEEHLGTITDFGFVMRRSGQNGGGVMARRFVARTSAIGNWYLLADLIYCPTPDEQIQLRNQIRASNKLCSIAEWEAMHVSGCLA